jgi:hypothetical protein
MNAVRMVDADDQRRWMAFLSREWEQYRLVKQFYESLLGVSSSTSTASGHPGTVTLTPSTTSTATDIPCAPDVNKSEKFREKRRRYTVQQRLGF